MTRALICVAVALVACGSPDVPVRLPSGGQPPPSPLATATATPIQQFAPPTSPPTPTCTPGNPIRTPLQALPPSPGGCLP